MAESAAPGAPAAPLPRRAALLYASGSFSGNLLTRLTGAWLFYFYAADEADGEIARRVAPALVGVILTATGLLSALDDPLIGHWSDRTRSRWGRRLPFVLFATPVWAALFFLLWTPPVAGASLANAAWLLVVLGAYGIARTLSGGPLGALLPEIAPGQADRMRLAIAQVFFGTLGIAAALIASGPLIDRFGFAAVGAGAALLALGSRYVALAGAWRHARRDVPAVELSFAEAFRASFRNEQFRAFLPSSALFDLSFTLLIASIPFFVRAILRADAERVGTYSSLLTAAPIAVLILALPLIQRDALRRGKARAYSRAMLVGIVSFPLLFLVGFVPGVPPLAQALVVLLPVGLAAAGVSVFPIPIMADIIDHEARQNGQRREGTYYAALHLVDTLVVALHAVILAGLLQLGGTADDPLGIRLVGPVAGVGALVSWLIFRRSYTLPDGVDANAAPAAGGQVARVPGTRAT